MFHQHSIACDCHDLTNERSLPVGNVGKLGAALALVCGFAIVELLVGLHSHSLALLADSGHLVSDSLVLGLALLAGWISRFPPSQGASFGYRRVEILVALVNGLGLVTVALWIAWEAIDRLQSPPVEILSLPMLIMATVGLGVNSLTAGLLHNHSHNDLNLRAAFLHVVADAFSSVGVILAAAAVNWLHWLWADSVVSLLVAGVVIAGAIPLIGQSLNILLERSPGYLSIEQIQMHLAGVMGVTAVSGLKVWSIAPGQEMLCAHLTVDLDTGKERDRLLAQIQASLYQEFGIQEAVLQMTSPPASLNSSIAELMGLTGFKLDQ